MRILTGKVHVEPPSVRHCHWRLVTDAQRFWRSPGCSESEWSDPGESVRFWYADVGSGGRGRGGDEVWGTGRGRWRGRSSRNQLYGAGRFFTLTLCTVAVARSAGGAASFPLALIKPVPRGKHENVCLESQQQQSSSTLSHCQVDHECTSDYRRHVWLYCICFMLPRSSKGICTT